MQQLRTLGGSLALLLQLDGLLRVKGASDFLFAGPLLGIAPTADGQLEHPVTTYIHLFSTYIYHFLAGMQRMCPGR